MAFRTSPIALILFLLGATVLVLSACATKKPTTPVVFASGEELHGSWSKTSEGIAAFKGIPFAAPPVGDLRWRAPVANTSRSGPQRAIDFAPACMQNDYMVDWYVSVAESFGSTSGNVGRPNGVSEDCLYLNVWSPLPDKDSSLPVMVWVHGGSNKGGWSYEPNYLGSKLAAKGVVVVSIAYRLGAFGFFSHPALDNGEGEAIANFGLLDVARAFQWVSDNIESFGGDPDNITLMGESAGAGNISDLVATNLAEEPIYHRIILQSSASGLRERRTLEDEQALGQRLANSMGFGNTVTAGELRSIPAEDLLTAYMTELKGHYFDAVIDELTMKQSPLENLRQVADTKLDVLIGTNADEWYMYIDKETDLADLKNTIEQLLPEQPGPGQAGQEQVATLMTKVSHLTDARRAADKIKTAQNMLCPSRYLAAKITGLGGRGFVYYFSRQRPGPGGVGLGAYHGTEIPYVFDSHDDWLPSENVDHDLTAAVMDYWVQFARSGNPSLPNRPQWPVYDRQNPMLMELGDNIAAIGSNDLGLCEWLGPAHGDGASESGASGPGASELGTRE